MLAADLLDFLLQYIYLSREGNLRMVLIANMTAMMYSDIHEGPHRMTLLHPVSSATQHADDEDHCPHTPASPRDYPVQRTLYESASTEIAGRSDIDEEEQSEGGDTCIRLTRTHHHRWSQRITG